MQPRFQWPYVHLIIFKMASTVAAFIKRVGSGSNLCSCKMSCFRANLESSATKKLCSSFKRSFTRVSFVNKTNERAQQDVHDGNEQNFERQKTNFTHFGYENVSETEKKQKGIGLFKYISCNYITY